jgi:hypothetical protein
MAIIVEAISVIIKDSALEREFLNGDTEILDIVPKATYASDSQLHKASFLSAMDVVTFVKLLQKHGLKFIEDGEFVDIAVVDMIEGLTAKCPWLDFSRGKYFEGMSQFIRSNEDFSIVWYNESPYYGIPCDQNGRVNIDTPLNWTPDNARDGFTFVPIDKMDSQLINVGKEDRIEKYWYAGSGDILYTGRPGINRKSSMLSMLKKNWKRIRHII